MNENGKVNDQFGGDGLTISHIQEDDIHVLSARGYVDLSTLGHLDHALATMTELGPRRLIVDLSGVSFFSSSGAKLLLEANKRLGSDCLAVVVEPGRVAGNITRVVDPNDELTRYESLESALADARS